MELGDRIAKLRKSRGMTQEQLGEYLGTTRQAVSKWEAGRAMPELDLIVKMGELFGVTMDSLILGRSAPAEEETPRTEAAEQNTNQKGGKTGLLAVVIALTVVGFTILCLCPLFAELYRSFVFETKGSAFTDATLYLWQCPLKWVVFLGVVLLLAGIVGTVWTVRKSK